MMESERLASYGRGKSEIEQSGSGRANGGHLAQVPGSCEIFDPECGGGLPR